MSIIEKNNKVYKNKIKLIIAKNNLMLYLQELNFLLIN